MHLLFSVTWGTVSGWWTPVCLLLGLLYAWLMNQKPTKQDKPVRYGLFAARTIAVFILGFLLISPQVKSTTYTPQKPLVLIAEDNSQSINTFKQADFNAGQLVNDLSKLKQDLGDKYDVSLFHFGRDLRDSLSSKFDDKQTNISSAIHQLNERFSNQNNNTKKKTTDNQYNQG